MAYGLLAIPGVSDWIAPRRNMLAGLGAGLLNGNPGAGIIEGRQADDAYATMQKAETERQKAITPRALGPPIQKRFAPDHQPSRNLSQVRFDSG